MLPTACRPTKRGSTSSMFGPMTAPNISSPNRPGKPQALGDERSENDDEPDDGETERRARLHDFPVHRQTLRAVPDGPIVRRRGPWWSGGARVTISTMSAEPWTAVLESSPVDWLLEPENPAVRAMTLERLFGCGIDDDDVVAARSRAMTVDPIAGILEAQDERGWWVKPGPGYSPKYTGTVWNLIFLAQLGADPADRSSAAGMRLRDDLHGNVERRVRVLLGGGGTSAATVVGHSLPQRQPRARVDPVRPRRPRGRPCGHRLGGAAHPRRGRRTMVREHSSTRFCVRKQRRSTLRMGSDQGAAGTGRSSRVESDRSRTTRGLAGGEFLLSTDPADADYPMGYGNTKPSSSWFKLGFPSGYVSDVLAEPRGALRPRAGATTRGWTGRTRGSSDPLTMKDDGSTGTPTGTRPRCRSTRRAGRRNG